MYGAFKQFAFLLKNPRKRTLVGAAYVDTNIKKVKIFKNFI